MLYLMISIFQIREICFSKLIRTGQYFRTSIYLTTEQNLQFFFYGLFFLIQPHFFLNIPFSNISVNSLNSKLQQFFIISFNRTFDRCRKLIFNIFLFVELNWKTCVHYDDITTTADYKSTVVIIHGIQFSASALMPVSDLLFTLCKSDVRVPHACPEIIPSDKEFSLGSITKQLISTSINLKIFPSFIAMQELNTKTFVLTILWLSHRIVACVSNPLKSYTCYCFNLLETETIWIKSRKQNKKEH